MRLVTDFLRVVRGQEGSISTTDLGDSVNGHLVGFCADRAMDEHRIVDLAWPDDLLAGGGAHGA